MEGDEINKVAPRASGKLNAVASLIQEPSQFLGLIKGQAKQCSLGIELDRLRRLQLRVLQQCLPSHGILQLSDWFNHNALDLISICLTSVQAFLYTCKCYYLLARMGQITEHKVTWSSGCKVLLELFSRKELLPVFEQRLPGPDFLVSGNPPERRLHCRAIWLLSNFLA